MALMKLQTEVIKMETCPDANERQLVHLCAYVVNSTLLMIFIVKKIERHEAVCAWPTLDTALLSGIKDRGGL